MKIVLLGEEIFKLQCDKISKKEIAKKFNVDVCKVSIALEKYNAHIKRYSEEEVYRCLYDGYIEMYKNEELSESLFTRTYYALCRSNLYTLEDMMNNRKKILSGRCRGISGKSLELIFKCFYKEMYLSKLDEECINDKLTSSCRNKFIKAICEENTSWRDKLKTDLAINAVNHMDDDNSKYSRVSTYIDGAIKILSNNKDKLEELYIGLAKLGTSSNKDIITYILNNI